MAFEYLLWNHRIVSDFDLGELEPGGEGAAGRPIQICRLADGDCFEFEDGPLLEDRFENGDLWFASYRDGEDGYVLRFPELCSFGVWAGEMRIECAPSAGVDDSTIAHLILDHALPRLLSLTAGHVVFHASGIQVGDGVVAVLGQSGQGKSTLAGWFASQGHSLLTDDCLVVRRDEAAGRWLAQPSYHSVRLWPDSVDALGIPDSELREFAGYTTKKRTGREVDFRFASGGLPLTACFVLPPPEEPAHSGPPELRQLAVNEAFLALAGAVFRIDPVNARVNRREFEALTSLTDSVRFWSLRYEREYRWLAEVREAMIGAVRTEN